MSLFEQLRAYRRQVGMAMEVAIRIALLSALGSILAAPSNPLELLFLAMVVPKIVALLRGNPSAIPAGLILFIATRLVSVVDSRLWPYAVGPIAVFGWCLHKAESRGTIRDVALLLIPVALYLALPVYYSPVRWNADCPSAGLQAGDLVVFEKSRVPAQYRIPATCLGAGQAWPSGRPVVVLASDANPESLSHRAAGG